jgi:uncharacterized protein (TIGR03905 family)
MYSYEPKGVCSKKINFSISNDGTIMSVSFIGGCPGNLLGLTKLVEGMKVDEAIARLKGITCGSKSTSCPDQLSIALEQQIAKM